MSPMNPGEGPYARVLQLTPRQTCFPNVKEPFVDRSKRGTNVILIAVAAEVIGMVVIARNPTNMYANATPPTGYASAMSCFGRLLVGKRRGLPKGGMKELTGRACNGCLYS